MPLRLIPPPEVNKFIRPTESLAKPYGLIAETLNGEHVDYHRSDKYTRDKYFIHVSDLIQSTKGRKFCARQHALTFIEQRSGTYIRKISAGMSLLHKFGHAAQKHMTDDFIKRSPHGHKVWGNWRCICGHSHAVMQTKPIAGTCKKCEHPIDQYEEIDLLIDTHRITGHPDLFILWGNTLHIYEIKTLDREGIVFDLLEAPLGDHTIQGTFYYFMCMDMVAKGLFPPGLQISPMINYLYADRSNKKLFGRTVYREFEKRASPAERIKPMTDNAKLLKESLDKSILPTRICADPTVPRAKACNVCISCFNRKRNTIDG